MSNPKSLRSQVAEQADTLSRLATLLETMLNAAAPTPLPAPVKAGPVTLAAKAKKAKYVRPNAVIGWNSERSGIELTFAGPIPKEASRLLMASGYRYNASSHVWYIKVRNVAERPGYTVAAEALAVKLSRIAA